jgi:hypothetical protein
VTGGAGGGGSPRLLFQWYETAPPDKRVPLAAKVADLAAASVEGAALASAVLADLDPRSWFAVHWLPIACHAHTAHLVKGAFVTCVPAGLFVYLCVRCVPSICTALACLTPCVFDPHN